MRFKLTPEHQNLVDQLEVVNSAIGKWKFAFIPTKINDGSYVWLENYFEIVKECVGIFNDEYKTYLSAVSEKVRYIGSNKAEYKVYVLGLKEPYRGKDALHHLEQFRHELIQKIDKFTY